jgi:hypothetical protein
LISGFPVDKLLFLKQKEDLIPMETSSHEHSKPNSGNLHPQLAAFDDLLTRAAASLPRINPGRVPETERTPQIELQVVSAILIQDYWKMFEGARQRSKPNPAVGYFNGMDQRFMRSAESMHAEFDNYPSAHTVIDRLMPAMQEGLFSVMDRWILLRNSESTAASTRDAPENRAYARLQALLAEKHARRVTDLKTYFAAGMNTALASMMGSASVVPKVFERTFGSAILRDTHAQILEQVFNFHRRMAAGNFDSFVAFANKIHGGLGGPLRGNADPELFASRRRLSSSSLHSAPTIAE